jgi:hypothetical protein
MPITEPVTMLTDYLLAAACIVFAERLRRQSASLRGFDRLWWAGFWATALAAVAGGTAHGFALFLGLQRLRVLWMYTVFLIGAATVLILAAGLLSVWRPAVGQSTSWLKRGLLVSLAALAVLPIRFSLHEHFNYNDIFHVVQTAGMYCFYRAAALQASRTETGKRSAPVESASSSL